MTLQNTRAFSCEVRELGPVIEVAMRGDLDLCVLDECSLALTGPLSGPRCLILLDLSGVTFLDSSGLRLLIDTLAKAEATGSRMLLSGASDAVERLFEVSGLGSVFERVDSITS